MIHDLIMKQLLATRASAEALIQSIDMFQSLVSDGNPAPGKAPAPPPPIPPEASGGVCDHPAQYRVTAPTMGNTRRQLCGVCGHEVDTTAQGSDVTKEEG